MYIKAHSKYKLKGDEPGFFKAIFLKAKKEK
jgi:hypothetical protein